MAGLSTLIDDATTQNTTLWDYTNGASESGGVIHVPATPAFNDLTAKTTYDLTGGANAIYCKVSPSTGGAGAVTGLVLASATDGTDMRIEYDNDSVTLRFSINNAFADASMKTIPYDATAHKWWRIRGGASTVNFETSPDNTTWTTQRSSPYPGAGYSNAIRPILSAFNVSGTSTASGWSNINTATGGGANTPPGSTPVVGSLTDTWQSFNTAVWNEQDPTGSAVTIANGVLSVSALATGFPHLQSQAVYDLRGSALVVKMLPAQGGVGATTEMVLASSTSGTDLRWQIDWDAKTITAASNVGFADGAATVLAYVPAQHVFFRISENSGTVSFDTSPDGQTGWVSRRTLTTPGYANSVLVLFSAEATTTSTSAALFSNLNGAGTSTPPPGGGGGGATPKAETLATPFTGAVIDTSVWTAFGEVAQQDQVIITASDAGYPTLTSVNNYDLTESYFLVKIKPAPGANEETSLLVLASTGTSYLRIRFANSAMLAEYYNGTTLTTVASKPYAVTSSYVWVRIRHTGSTVFFDSAPDVSAGATLTWTNFASLAAPAFVNSVKCQLSADLANQVVTPPPVTPPPSGSYTAPPAAPSVFVALTSDLSSTKMAVQPWWAGQVCTTFGTRWDTSTSFAAVEKQLDLRFKRIPIKWDGSKINSSAGGGPNADMQPLITAYLNAGYKLLLVLGGRTSDADIATGDVTAIVNRLGMGNGNIIYQSQNEPSYPGNVVSQATNDYNEGHAVNSAFRILGPVLASYDSGNLSNFLSAMGVSRLAGLDWHNYAMGEHYTDFPTAMTVPAQMGSQVTTQRSALISAGLNPPFTSIDELNYSWRYTADATAITEFFKYQNLLWIAKCFGEVLSAGGAPLQFGTQNGPLSCFQDQDFGAGQNPALYPTNPPVTGNPMPSYYGIQAWTGGQGGSVVTGNASSWPHYKDTIHNVSSGSADISIYSVNNEAGGHTLILINQNTTTDHQQIVTLTQGATRMNGYDAYQSAGAAAGGTTAFNPYSRIANNVALAGTGNNQMWCNLKAGSVTVVVLKP